MLILLSGQNISKICPVYNPLPFRGKEFFSSVSFIQINDNVLFNHNRLNIQKFLDAIFRKLPSKPTVFNPTKWYSGI